MWLHPEFQAQEVRHLLTQMSSSRLEEQHGTPHSKGTILECGGMPGHTREDPELLATPARLVVENAPTPLFRDYFRVGQNFLNFFSKKHLQNISMCVWYK